MNSPPSSPTFPPHLHTLTSWIGELAPETRKRLVSKGIRTVHSEAFKNAAVIDLCMRPLSAQASANKLGVDRTTLYNWKNKLLGPEAEFFKLVVA